ncbi:MAG TPA: hypothetical protein VGB17_08540 [Pyrinomonadaceae bacterium]|jgi:hypothetical protein
MKRFDNPLEHVSVAAPCTADWDAMLGDERVRFCSQCRLNVYNLSGMSKREAEALIGGTEGRLCARFYRRPDGSILTRNCPVGLSNLKRRASRVAAAFASALVGFMTGIGFHAMTNLRVDSLPFVRQTSTHHATLGVLAVPERKPETVKAPPMVKIEDTGKTDSKHLWTSRARSK